MSMYHVIMIDIFRIRFSNLELVNKFFFHPKGLRWSINNHIAESFYPF